MFGQKNHLLRVIALMVLAASGFASSPAAARPEVGDPAPPFHGVTFDGEEISLEDLRGHVVILNFWATWCPPCLEELPLLESYMRARKDAGLYVVAVTLDAEDASESILNRLEAVLTLPLLESFEGDYLPVEAYPTNYVIDRMGNIRIAKAEVFTLEQLDDVLPPLLNEPAPPALAATVDADATAE